VPDQQHGLVAAWDVHHLGGQPLVDLIASAVKHVK